MRQKLLNLRRTQARARAVVYERFLRPLLFSLPPAAAHDLGLAGLEALDPEPMAELVTRALGPVPQRPVHRMGLVFPHPVGLAGGFDKNARVPRALEALGFGFLELGTVTARAQEPNPAPNLFRLPKDHALVNRLGFPNEGAARVAARLAERRARKAFTVPVGLSIGKSRVVSVEDEAAVIADYKESLRAVLPVSDFVVVNVSSPNTANLRALQSAETAERLLRALVDEAAAMGKGATPILVKVAPDLPDDAYDALLEVVPRVGLAGVVATNTTITRAGLATDAAEVAAMGAGGLSGPPVRARALAMVARARAALGPEKTVIGVGGIEAAEHAKAYLDAGADLVQLYTGFVYGGPLVARTIAAAL
jgi:dihydroorotate dehydrogenase